MKLACRAILVSPLEGALDCANHGLAVFPVHGIVDGRCTCRDAQCGSPGKHPIFTGWQKDATANNVTIRKWASELPGCNFGIPTGKRSKIVVVEVDPYQGGHLRDAPVRPEVISLSGRGFHCFFRANGTIIGADRKFGPGIGLRGEGHFVVAPGSVHWTGRRYGRRRYGWDRLHEAPVLMLPEAKASKVPAAPADVKVGPRYVAAALENESASVRSAAVGSRNETLNRAAFALARYVVSGELLVDAVEAALLEAALAAGLPEREARRTIASGLGARSGAAVDDHEEELERREHDDPEGDAAFDLAYLPETSDGEGPMVVEGLLRSRGVIGVVGEEGEGKTTFADQFCRQLARGESVMEVWDPGELRPERILFVDTHQERPEILAKAREMDLRGLATDPGRMFWWDAGPLDLLEERDRLRLSAQIAAVGADFVWIDAGSHLVADSKDDVQVTALFDHLSSLMRDRDLKGVGVTLFPRKRPSQGFAGRAFDDLFGSREWKGRQSIVLYLDTSKVIAFKDRPGFLRRSWPKPPGGRYPVAKLERPGLSDPRSVPFRIIAAVPDDIADAEALKATALRLVGENPDRFTKNSLAQAMGGRKSDALDAIGSLVGNSQIGPDRDRAKLHVLAAESSGGLLL